MAHEKPGRPGFHFQVLQPAKTGPKSYMRKNPSGFGGHFVKQRRYPVYFKIGHKGHPVYIAGVKPTDETMKEAQHMIDGMRNPRLLDIPCTECLVPQPTVEPRAAASGRIKMAKMLTGADRAKFLALSNACGDPNQLARIKARLNLNKFIIEHGEPICKATFDDVMRRRKKNASHG